MFPLVSVTLTTDATDFKFIFKTQKSKNVASDTFKVLTL